MEYKFSQLQMPGEETIKIQRSKHSQGFGRFQMQNDISDESLSYRQPLKDISQDQMDDNSSQQFNIDHRTNQALYDLNQVVIAKIPWYERVLYIFATPFSYETGFYFKGKKTYHVQGCGIVSLLGSLFLFASFIVLFGPILIGSTIKTDLKIIPFNTPADIPANDSIPSSLSQFFGRQVPRQSPTLNLDEFFEQFYRIDVYGATQCNNTYPINDILICTANTEQSIINFQCQETSTSEKETKLFGFTQKIQISLKRNENLQNDNKMPKDSMIQCKFIYNSKSEIYSQSSNTLLINVLQKYKMQYNQNNNQIQKQPIQPEEQLNQNMLVLRKGYPNKLVTIVNELVDNFISANGQQKSGYKSYFTEESLSLNIPFQNQTDSGVAYEASINFQFNLQYQYNNYKASFIDALVKFGTVLVFYFIIWGICCRIVKFMFYKELTNEILRADQQVQMSEGMLPQTKRQSLLRFSNELSFSKLYFNQFQVKKLELLMNDARKRSLEEMQENVKQLQDFDNMLILKAENNEQQFLKFDKLIQNLENQNLEYQKEIEQMKSQLDL